MFLRFNSVRLKVNQGLSSKLYTLFIYSIYFKVNIISFFPLGNVYLICAKMDYNSIASGDALSLYLLLNSSVKNHDSVVICELKHLQSKCFSNQFACLILWQVECMLSLLLTWGLESSCFCQSYTTITPSKKNDTFIHVLHINPC